MIFFQNCFSPGVFFLALVLFLFSACSFKPSGERGLVNPPRCNDSAGVFDDQVEQGRIDSAMGFYQASNEFWEQGELGSAIEALDKSYALILEIEAGDLIEGAYIDRLEQK